MKIIMILTTSLLMFVILSSTAIDINPKDMKVDIALQHLQDCHKDLNSSFEVLDFQSDEHDRFYEWLCWPPYVSGWLCWPPYNQQGEYSVGTDGNYVYTARWNSVEFYRYDFDGNYIGEFTITGVSHLRDMIYDGEYFYGSDNSSTIFEMDLANETLISSITTTVSNIRSIAHDRENDGFWVGDGWSPDTLVMVDRSGNTIETLPITVNSISGLCWENISDGEPYLWAYTADAENMNDLVQIDMTTGEELNRFDIISSWPFHPPPPPVGVAGGLDITNLYVSGWWGFLGMIQNESVWYIPIVAYGFIEGNVTLDGGGGDIIAVEITAGGATVNPNTSGDYNIEIVTGTYDVTASLDNYISETIENVEVLQSQTTTDVDFILSYLPPYIPPPVNLNVESFDDFAFFSWDEPNYEPPSELIEHDVYLDSIFLGTTEETGYLLTDLIDGETYEAGVVAVYNLGSSVMATIEFEYTVVEADETEVSVSNYSISNYPNPFNPDTTIYFELPNEFTNPRVEIFNLKGRKVRELQPYITTGEQVGSVVWDGKDNNDKSVSSGVYLFRLKTDEYVSEADKMMLVK